MTDRIAELEAELAKEKAKSKASGKLNIKFGNKRNVVVGGPALGQKYPVTLYAPGWLVVLEHAEEIRAFIEENRDQLSWERE